MKKTLTYFLIFILFPSIVFAQSSLSERLSGRILLSIEENGEAWYVFPNDLNRYYLGKPSDAFNILKNLGVGISNKDLEKIPTGVIKSNETDSDQDGLSDNLEIALGTNPQNKDSDDDGYWDGTEIIALFNPLGENPLNLDLNFTEKNLGKIFIQTEKNGEAWYVNPIDKRKYYLSKPKIAFEIMRQFGLGISIKNLAEINIKKIIIPEKPNNQNSSIYTPPNNNSDKTDVINNAANAIRSKNISKTQSFFVSEMSASLEYSLTHMPDESILTLGNLLSGSHLNSSDNNKLTYKNTVYYDGKNYDIYFNVEKQEDGQWLITNL